MKVTELEPKILWKHFNNICSIPHPSGHEEKLIEYIIKFCAKNDIECIKDSIGNLLLKKCSTLGLENARGLTLQAHLDMVPQNDDSIEHDFHKDSIKPIINGDWVSATDTTLGADNGIGVAAILAIMESSPKVHGPLSAILTVEEETGLSGVNNLTPEFIPESTLINLDSEELEEVFISCAGGCETKFTLSHTLEKIENNEWNFFELKVSGLEGGHSGVDIHLGRGNANLIIGELLYPLAKNNNLRIISINGGSLANAIPRDGVAIFAIKKNESTKAVVNIQNIAKKLTNKTETDKNLLIKIANSADANFAISSKDSNRIVTALAKCANGAISMSSSMKDIVETSSSLGSIKSDKKTTSIITMQRSLIESEMIKLRGDIVSLMEENGFKTYFGDSFPPWEPAKNESEILNIYLKSYITLFNKKPKIVAIHAGLECGVIGKIKGNMDMISFGPTIKFPHSPKEKVNIKSVNKFWKLLLQIVANFANDLQ